MRTRLAIVVAVGVVLPLAVVPTAVAQGGRSGQRVSGAQPSTPPPSAAWMDLARTYLKALRTHQIGVADGSAVLVAKWPTDDMVSVIGGIVEIVKTLHEAAARDARVGREQPFSFDGRTFTRAQFRQFLGLEVGDAFITNPNEILKRAAMLHMDIAMYAPVFAAPSTAPGTVVRRALLSVDGHVIEVQDNSLHWSHARTLLAAVASNPSTDDWVRQWYVATVSWQADHKMWSVCLEHAANAAVLFPSDARFPFATGVVHEVFALPRMQAAREASAPGVNDGRTELGQAAAQLRKALALDPSFAEAHLHYGHVLSGLGAFQEAERELKRAEMALKEPRLKYLVALFLGYAQSELGAREAARASFERAAAVFPRAQSPLLGLSQVARRADDGPEAAAALERLFALPRHRGADDDPWWDYDRTHSRNAEALVTDVRSVFARGAK